MNFFKGLFSSSTPQNVYKKHDRVREYTDGELYEEICNSENLPPMILAVICAEILRRRIDKDVL